jgi:hypothetical protein
LYYELISIFSRFQNYAYVAREFRVNLRIRSTGHDKVSSERLEIQKFSLPKRLAGPDFEALWGYRLSSIGFSQKALDPRLKAEIQTGLIAFATTSTLFLDF